MVTFVRNRISRKKGDEDIERYMRLSRIHLELRQKRLDELDIDLRAIFNVPIEQVFDRDIEVAERIQEIRCQRQGRGRRGV